MNSGEKRKEKENRTEQNRTERQEEKRKEKRKQGYRGLTKKNAASLAFFVGIYI